MTTKPCVLVVDDDDFSVDLVHQALEDAFRVEHAADGAAGIMAARDVLPDFILMDVEMPGMNGYAVCRSLKADTATRHIPLIFLSGHVEEEDRLAGYDAGGDDYMLKPYRPSELRGKIDRLLQWRKENTQLSHEAVEARSVAMTALSSAGDFGVAMRFMSTSLNCRDFNALADAILAAVNEYGLDAVVQLREKNGALSRNRDGLCSPLEESVLKHMAGGDRIASLGSCTSINYEWVTLLVRNMPLKDAERTGRLRDSLAIIAEAANNRVRALITEIQVARRSDDILRLLQRLAGVVSQIDIENKALRSRISEILHRLVGNVEDSFISLGLLENQESYLQQLIRNTTNEALTVYGEEERIEQLMAKLTEEIQGLLGQKIEPPAASPPSPNSASEVDLW